MYVEDDGDDDDTEEEIKWDQFSKVTHSSSAPSPPLYDEDGGGRGVDDDDDDDNNGDMLIQSTHKSLPTRWSRSAFIQMLITLKAKITMNSMFITEWIWMYLWRFGYRNWDKGNLQHLCKWRSIL